MERRERTDAAGAVEQCRSAGKEEVAARHLPPVKGIDDLDERLVALLALAALEPLRCLHFVNGNGKALVAGTVDNRNKLPEEGERHCVVDITPEPGLLLEVPPDVGLRGDPPEGSLRQRKVPGVVCTVIGPESRSKCRVHLA